MFQKGDMEESASIPHSSPAPRAPKEGQRRKGDLRFAAVRRRRGATGVRTNSPLLGVQAGIDLRVALRAVPLHQLHGEVSVAQLRDEIFRHRDPPAGAGAKHHMVALTVFQRSLVVWGGHGRASAGQRPGAHDLTSWVDGPRRKPRARTSPMRLASEGKTMRTGHHVSRLRHGLHLIGSWAAHLSAPKAGRWCGCRGWGAVAGKG